jgi:hypothetical protein
MSEIRAVFGSTPCAITIERYPPTVGPAFMATAYVVESGDSLRLLLNGQAPAEFFSVDRKTAESRARDFLRRDFGDES